MRTCEVRLGHKLQHKKFFHCIETVFSETLQGYNKTPHANLNKTTKQENSSTMCLQKPQRQKTLLPPTTALSRIHNLVAQICATDTEYSVRLEKIIAYTSIISSSRTFLLF